jgi:hypothetical protein
VEGAAEEEVEVAQPLQLKFNRICHAFMVMLTEIQFCDIAIQAIVGNGIVMAESLIGLTPKDIENVMTIIRKSTPPIVIHYVSQKRLTILT